MTLFDQLEELRTNILRDTSDLISGNPDKLWSDESLLRYIKDAERRFARHTMLIRDSSTTAITQVTLATGIKTYTLHASVIGVLSCRYDTDAYDLKRTGHALVNDLVPAEFLSFDPSIYGVVQSGAPMVFYTDETTVNAGVNAVTLTVYPEPSATQNGKKLYLRVIRLPITTYASNDLARESEIPEDYQLDVLEWAAYRAMRGIDGDAGSPIAADAHKQAFEAAVAQAIRETKRKIFVSTGLRFGTNGFSWTR